MPEPRRSFCICFLSLQLLAFPGKINHFCGGSLWPVVQSARKKLASVLTTRGGSMRNRSGLYQSLKRIPKHLFRVTIVKTLTTTREVQDIGIEPTLYLVTLRSASRCRQPRQQLSLAYITYNRNFFFQF